MVNLTATDNYVNGWSVLFNVPNTIAWIRIVLLFISIRYFGRRKYLLFIIFHTTSGLLDNIDGILARSLQQYSLVGKYFEYILDQYSHFIMYTCNGLLYPTYIMYFYLEIALELWNPLFNLYVNSLPKTDPKWLHKPTFLSTSCSLTIHDHPNLRLLNWYGPDIFHTLLVIRYILMEDSNRKLIAYIKRHIAINKVYAIIRYTLYFTGFFSLLRTYVVSCVMMDKLETLASAKEITFTE